MVHSVKTLVVACTQLLHQDFRILQHFVNSDLGQISHTQTFIAIYNAVHPEDGCRKQPKHVCLVNKQCI